MPSVSPGLVAKDWTSPVAAAILLANLFQLGALFQSGALWPDIGDWSMRAIHGLDHTLSGPCADMFSRTALTHVWPPGHACFHRVLFRLLDPGSLKSTLGVYYLVSLSMWLVGTIGLAASMAQIAGRRYFWIALLALMSSTIVLIYSYSGMAGIFLFGFLGVATYCVVRGFVHGRIGWLGVAAISLLAASFFRNEAAIYILAIAVFLAVNRRFNQAVVFCFISSPYLLLRVLYFVVADRDNPRNWMRFGKTQYEFQDGMVLLGRMAGRVWELDSGLVAMWVVVLFVLALASLWLRRKGQSRRPGQVEPSLVANRQAARLFPLVALFSGIFLIAALYRRQINYQERYLISFLPFVGLSAIGCVWRLEPRIRTLARGAGLLTAIRLILVGSAMSAVVRFGEHRPTLPPDDACLVHWLRKDRANSRILFDFLLWRETRLMLLTRDPTAPNESWMYSYDGGYVPAAVERKARNGSVDGSEKVRLRAHQYLYFSRPKFVVLPSDSSFDKVSNAHLPGSSHRATYLRDDLVRLGGDVYRFQSKYIPEPVFLAPAFENDSYLVLRNLGADLLETSSSLSEAAWRKEGHVTVREGETAVPRSRQLAATVELAEDAALFQVTREVVRTGDTLTAQIWLWANEPGRTVSLEIGRHGPDRFEGSNEEVMLTGTPTQHRVSHCFSSPHPQARILLRGQGPGVSSFYAWGASVFRASPGRDVSEQNGAR
jgi:hypothetical protein